MCSNMKHNEHFDNSLSLQDTTMHVVPGRLLIILEFGR